MDEEPDIARSDDPADERENPLEMPIRRTIVKQVTELPAERLTLHAQTEAPALLMTANY
jgi:hypothetical protein